MVFILFPLHMYTLFPSWVAFDCLIDGNINGIYVVGIKCNP